MSGWFPRLGVEALLVGGGFLGFGYLLADTLIGRRPLDRLSRWALALPATVGWAFALMLCHLLSGGRVFSHPWLVRGITAALTAGLLGVKLARGDPPERAARAHALAAGALVAVALAVWAAPVVRLVPLGAPGSDTGWHMGWTNQVLNGQTTPSAPITGAVPNYYPWMFHATTALLTAFTPSGDPFRALGPVQVVQVTGATLALFALGRQIGRTWAAGAATAFFGALGAGFGVALIGAVNRAVRTPRAGGPRGTYNIVYNNLAPPLPRDLGYTLLLAFLVLLLTGLVLRDPPILVGAGVALGLAGLCSAEFFFVGLVVAAVMTARPAGLGRGPVGAALLLPALAVFAVWLVPLMISYARLGGFVNTTAVQAVVLGPVAILMSWGLVAPLGAYGLIRSLPRAARDPGARLVVATLVASAVVLVLSAAVPRALGQGFSILGRASRYWPLLELAASLLAGVGAARLLEQIPRPALAAGVAAAAVAIALPLPLDVSLGVPGAAPRTPLLAASVLGRGASFLDALRRAGPGTCVMAAPPAVGFLSFAQTGYRLVALRADPAHPGNAARVRWRGIYRRIPTDELRARDQSVLFDPAAPPAAWTSVARRYSLDLLVAPRSTGTARGLAPVAPSRGRLAVYRVASCPSP